ncbi:mRNA interferase MazF [Candidatus Promineifilum breve]|uniref:mRNA interferase n=1 Tax=Candidatus Promineifilum breve TaxID=1806508 RepID=A0A160T9G9_9CHLR|nr:type II toxin-antitoxin system PemK/MazF family toxin [Candidatus Promineifilum breve]CUS06128.1 mRNA interferase MazF [Candidatus Promineifilum breve]
MVRGDIYDARLSPVEGSEQAGTRPVVIVSRDAINHNSPVIVVIPLTDAANVRRVYPNNVPIPSGEGGLTLDSVALAGQVRAIAVTRLVRRRGALPPATMSAIDRALRITLDL